MHFTQRNLILIFVAILVVGGAFVLAEYRNKEMKKVVYTAPIIKAVADALPPDLQAKDTDNDGLKDWEEGLLGTDPRKADTDGDGTSDGNEATQGRNPLVKGPNDKASDTPKSSAPAAPLTQTDKVARDFFARYLELKQAGLSNDKNSQAELVGTVLKNGLVLETPKTYAEKDFIITSDNSVAAKKNYGNELGAVFQANPLKGKDEAVIVKESIDADDTDLLKQIDPIIATYKKIIAGLKKIPVPKSAVQVHIETTNAVSAFLFVAESFRSLETDAIKGIQGLKEHQLAAQALIAAFQHVRTFLMSAGIMYEPAEAGYMFTKQ